MGTEKDSNLAGGALVYKKSYIHERPMVSLRNGEVIMTILLFYALSMAIDNFKFSLALTKILLSNFVEALWVSTECRRLRTKEVVCGQDKTIVASVLILILAAWHSANSSGINLQRLLLGDIYCPNDTTVQSFT